MTAAKPTPGPWRVSRTNAGLFISGAQPGYFCEVYAGNKTSMAHIPEQEANAALIAEAGNVHHETGLTPRELLEQRDELLAIVQRFIALPGGAWHPIRHAADEAELAEDARAAIAKAKGGEA